MMWFQVFLPPLYVDQKTFRRLLRILEIKLRVFGNWHIYLLVNMAAKWLKIYFGLFAVRDRIQS